MNESPVLSRIAFGALLLAVGLSSAAARAQTEIGRASCRERVLNLV